MVGTNVLPPPDLRPLLKPPSKLANEQAAFRRLLPGCLSNTGTNMSPFTRSELSAAATILSRSRWRRTIGSAIKRFTSIW